MIPTILFTDMDGTLYKKVAEETGLVAPSPWMTIPELLGPKAVACELESHKKWNAGEFRGYIEWVDESMDNHRRNGLTKSVFEKELDSVGFHDGTKETFDNLHTEGVVSVIVSGGFKYHANKAQKELGIRHAFASAEYFWEGEELVGRNVLPCDYQEKVTVMEMFMREYKTTPAECAFVGDGKNDVYLAKAVGTSISFNGSSDLEKVCTHVIRQPKGEEDFRAVLEYLQ